MPNRSASSAAPRKVMTREQLKFCSSILRQLKKHQDAPPFLFPVDPVALNIPDYFHFIKRPMDLSTAEKKLNNVEYETADDLASDIQLLVDNCVLYNGKESQISQRAVSLQKAFLNSMRNMPKDVSGHIKLQTTYSLSCHGHLTLTSCEQSRTQSQPLNSLTSGNQQRRRHLQQKQRRIRAKRNQGRNP